MKHNIKLVLNKYDNTSWEELTDRSNYSLLLKENDIENKNQFIEKS